MSTPISALAGGFERKFDLDPSILPAGGSSSLTVTIATDADVALALAKDQPFPTRPTGTLALSGVAFALDSGKGLKLQAGPTQVGISFSAGVNTGVGIYDQAALALDALKLPDTPFITLALDTLALEEADSTRYAVIRVGYQADGKVSGTHPIGAFGSFTFGAQTASSGLLAIVRRFPAGDGAATVLRQTVSSFRLPRHVGLNDQGEVNIAPGCWVIAEVEGSAALKLGAQLGYNFNFLHEARLSGLTGDIGLKVDAGLKATFGLDVSGKFLAVVGRPAKDSKVRLQLFKQNTKGMSFGLNLKVGVTGVAEVPEDVDDFVSAVFGIHGSQVAKALRNLDKWTDKKQSVSELVAGLANERATMILKATTGIDPATKFAAAKSKLLGVLDQWDALPGRVSSRLWKLVERPELDQLVAHLQVLADPKKTAAKLQALLGSSGLAQRIEGQWLNSVADEGLLALVNRLDFVRDTAQKTLDALDGGVLKKLQKHLNDALGLDGIRDATKAADFGKLDELLIGRLSLFLDKELDLAKLDEIKNAINTITTKRTEIFTQARKALNSTYTFEVAAAYRRVSNSDALIDAEFDLGKANARKLFTAVMTEGALDRLLVESVAGVELKQAAMSHGIARTSFVEVSMPMFSFRSDHANNSLAKVRADNLQVTEEGGRVLIYDLTASDEVRVRNQYKSRLSLALNTGAMRSTAIRFDADRDATWSYRLLLAKEHIKREELEGYARPFIEQYMPGQFTTGTDLSTFFTLFDAAVEDKLGNGKNEFGDVLTSMEVSIPGSALSAWLAPMTKDQRKLAKMRASRAIQAGVKRLLPFYYFQNIDRLNQDNAAASLLVWASIPSSTSIAIRNGRVSFNTDKEPYWDAFNHDEREAMVNDSHTAATLGATLEKARRRLQEAGLDDRARFFAPSEAGDFLALMNSGDSPRFKGLLFFEAEIIKKAAEALDDLANIEELLKTKPSEAIERLAEFGSDITEAFHDKLDGVYMDQSILRALGQMVFLEASKNLNPKLAAVQPQAMITMSVLTNGHKITLQKLLDGDLPLPEEIAVEQRLVNA